MTRIYSEIARCIYTKNKYNHTANPTLSHTGMHIVPFYILTHTRTDTKAYMHTYKVHYALENLHTQAVHFMRHVSAYSHM